MSPPNLYRSKTPGKITMASIVDTPAHGVELQPYSLTADWLGLGHKGEATMVGYAVLFPFQKS